MEESVLLFSLFVCFVVFCARNYETDNYEKYNWIKEV